MNSLVVSDFDNDLIPDWWEYKYFGNITNALSTEENLHAYIAGLVPGEKFEIYNYPIEWVNKPEDNIRFMQQVIY